MRRGWVGLLLMAFAGGVAAEAATLERGEKELTFKFSWTRFDPGVSGEDKVQNVNLEGTFGYLFTGAQEIGGLVTYSHRSDGSTATDKGLGVFYHYNFTVGEVLSPYLGARVTMLGRQDSAYKAAYGALAGLKVFPWAHGGFNVELAYDEYERDKAEKNAQQLGLFAGVLLKW
jgi:hypothetical protein